MTARSNGIPQHMQALALANERRFAAAAVRRELVAADRDRAAEMLWCADMHSLTVTRVLTALHGVGATKADRWCNAVRCHSNRRYEDLTQRQRAILADLLLDEHHTLWRLSTGCWSTGRAA